MDVELLVIPACPGAKEAAERLRAALDDIGLSHVTLTVGVIDTQDAARARHFAGSPALLVDGTDLFQTGEAPGALTCRVYPTPEGPRNVPTAGDLRRTLKARIAGAR